MFIKHFFFTFSTLKINIIQIFGWKWVGKKTWPSCCMDSECTIIQNNIQSFLYLESKICQLPCHKELVCLIVPLFATILQRRCYVCSLQELIRRLHTHSIQQLNLVSTRCICKLQNRFPRFIHKVLLCDVKVGMWCVKHAFGINEPSTYMACYKIQHTVINLTLKTIRKQAFKMQFLQFHQQIFEEQ